MAELKHTIHLISLTHWDREWRFPFEETRMLLVEMIDGLLDLLDTDLDPPRPWALETNIPVFSLALVKGPEGSRQWLVYAHSPLKDRKAVKITLPGCGKITVDVPRAGSFFVVGEADRGVKPLEVKP